MSARSKKPWACFETSGPTEDGHVGFSISFNTAFVDNLRAHGFEGMNDEEIVQMFFLSVRMVPEEFALDDAINPAATPNLTNEANRFVR